MARGKQRPQSHLTDEAAQQLLRGTIPTEWVLRSYKPDYGIDFSIEVFGWSADGCQETLGEHLLVQLKGTQTSRRRTVTRQPRMNIELYEAEDTPPTTGSPAGIDVVPFRIETSELVTVQRMGAAAPVLLVVAEVKARRLFYVCLNDYIDKVLLPDDPHYARAATKTLYVPIANELTSETNSLLPLQLYAKRAKLYSAFQKFAFQHNELDYTRNSDLDRRANHFADILLRLDVWDTPWYPIYRARTALESLKRTGSPGTMKYTTESLPEDLFPHPRMIDDAYGDTWPLEVGLGFEEIRLFWAELSNLGRIYEDIGRQWFLPTHLAAQLG